MGKGLVNLPEGQDFGAEHFGSEMGKNFGFSGSMSSGDSPEEHKSSPDGPVGGSAHHYAKGGHPHGFDPMPGGTESGPHGTIVHHRHGGFTHHHPDGTTTHHGADGMEVAMPQHASINGGHGPGEGTLVEKRMASAPPQAPDSGEPDGDEGMPAMARGGRSGLRARIPQSMKPKGAANHSPINSAPRNPECSVTKRNQMPGGQMPYGVEPSSEPDVAGSDQGIPQLARGGKMRGGAC